MATHLFQKAMRLLACTALVLPTGYAAARGDAEEASPQCPGVTAWYRDHPEQTNTAMRQRDAARIFSDPSLRAELDQRFERDQVVRYAALAAAHNVPLGRRVLELDADNVKWLFTVVRRAGFPTAAQVGEEGVRHAWLLAQHADTQPAFQIALLPALEQRHADGELDGVSLSRFTDRVLLAEHQPQRYGTQYPWETWATRQVALPDGQSVGVIDASRRALGIMPLADYVCMMTRGSRAVPETHRLSPD